MPWRSQTPRDVYSSSTVTFACLAAWAAKALSLVASGSSSCSAREMNRASAAVKLGRSAHARWRNGRLGKSSTGKSPKHPRWRRRRGPRRSLPQTPRAVLTREHLEDQQVRRGKLVLGRHERFDLLRDAHAEQEVDDRRRIEDGHSPWSRIERTASTLDSPGSTMPRAAIRADSSAGVGRDALRASTERRYSGEGDSRGGRAGL